MGMIHALKDIQNCTLIDLKYKRHFMPMLQAFITDGQLAGLAVSVTYSDVLYHICSVEICTKNRVLKYFKHVIWSFL